ncbi:MAG: hypothetical protein HKN23_18295 [Verrucomicrobiales bacterium]|nr:hypothetical protein [Verrucomicrobiales bacterium]
MTREENLSQFFGDDGNTVILPIDHGTAIPVPGMPDPVGLIEIMNPFVDGYVVNLGVGLAAMDQLSEKGVCFRTDVYKPPRAGQLDQGTYRIYGADEAEIVGANAMMNMLYHHHDGESDNFREVGELISEGFDSDIPVILEALPFGIGRPDDYTCENIAFVSRAAAEIGADVVKTAYPTDATVDEFREVIEGIFVPVIVLGGAAMGDDEGLLTMVKNSIDAGANGIAVGRNVWQHPNPPGIGKALMAIVHEGAGVDSALKLVSA